MIFPVPLNTRVKEQGVQKAGFFTDCPMCVDFNNKSSRKSGTIASECRPPFFSRKWISWSKKKKNIKTATTTVRAGLRPALASVLFLRAFPMGHRAYAPLARHLEAMGRKSRSTRESHRHCTRRREGDFYCRERRYFWWSRNGLYWPEIVKINLFSYQKVKFDIQAYF